MFHKLHVSKILPNQVCNIFYKILTLFKNTNCFKIVYEYYILCLYLYYFISEIFTLFNLSL